MLKRIWLALGFFMLSTVLVEATDFDAYVYWVPSGTRKQVAWNPVPGADGYEIYIWRMESSKVMYRAELSADHITVMWRTPGHYVAYVRAYSILDGVKTWGDWKNTLDPTVGLVNGQPRAWVLLVPTQ